MEGSSTSAHLGDAVTSGHGDRGLRKKWLKKLREGKVKPSDVPSGLLSSDDITYAVDNAALSIRITGAKQTEQGVTNADLQMLALTCLNQAALDHRWFDIQGKGGLTCFILLLAKGVTWVDWQEQKQQNTTTVPFLRSAQSLRLYHRRGRWWNAAVRVVEPMDSDILYLPRAAVVVDESADGGQGAGQGSAGRSKGKALQLWKATGEEEGNAASEEEDDEDEGVEPSILSRRVCSLSLSFAELSTHGYPLADTTSQTAEATPQWEDDPPGCIAGLSHRLSAMCTLRVPKGYMLTRTAHADLHALADRQGGSEPARSCPVFGHILYKQGPAPEQAGDDGEDAELEPPRLVALDCEMCMTDRGFQLARVSCVDDSETLAVDEYVKPLRPIKDYLTRYSGITPKILTQEAELTFYEVRDQVADALDGVDELSRQPEVRLKQTDTEGGEQDAGAGGMVAAGGTKRKAVSASDAKPVVYLESAVACGHSLENDLRALKLVHTRVIDTSLCKPFLHPQGLPSRMSLRHLSKQHLDRVIQTGHGRSDGGGGHDSAEDALAVLHLIHTIIFQPHGKKEEEEGVEDDVLHTEPMNNSDGKVTTSAPQSKRRRTEPGPAGEDSGPVDAEPPPVPQFTEYLARPLRDALRLRPVPERSEDTNTGSSGSAGGRSGAGTGVAGTLEGLRGASAGRAANNDQAEGTNKRTGLHAPPQPWGTDKHRSILALPDMSTPSVVCDVTLVGSAPFVNAHLCGSAGAVQVHVRYDAATATDMRRVTDRVLTEAKRIADSRVKAVETARAQGHAAGSGVGSRGPGFVLAEILVPHEGAQGGSGDTASSTAEHHKPDLKTFDQVLAGLCNHLPRGCFVMVATQSAQLRYSARKTGSDAATEENDPLAAAQTAKSGVVYFHTT